MANPKEQCFFRVFLFRQVDMNKHLNDTSIGPQIDLGHRGDIRHFRGVIEVSTGFEPDSSGDQMTAHQNWNSV
ncbi:hypothetical protein OI18_02495 [Flavihumibacter solisilvae]|uniref:Uncharacterized protein n=1 Tax=Flavihumibacter solisilvae TaxID=1349421 RepID=A0A0C1IZY9_9BACT|nr:hypothetical protein OI18_02495 [Flavihumibacter solisilvae]